MGQSSDIHKQLLIARSKARKQRMAIIATTVIIVVCSIIVIITKHHTREIEAQRYEQESRLRQQREENLRRSEETRIKEIESSRQSDSISAIPQVEEPEPYTPKYTWDEIETMIRNLTDENYFASVWCDEVNTPEWVVIYTKGGKTYFRHFNPEKKTYGNKIRLIKDGLGKFHVSGNKRDRSIYGNGGSLIHEVKGVAKETFFNQRMIDLYTPEPAPDGYEDWEDYYNDNEEDLLFYYGR